MAFGNVNVPGVTMVELQTVKEELERAIQEAASGAEYDDSALTKAIDDLKKLVGTTSVPDQISEAINDALENISDNYALASALTSALGRITDNEENIEKLSADMVGASANTSGKHGLVPAPKAGDNLKFLGGDGHWYDPLSRLDIGGVNLYQGTKDFSGDKWVGKDNWTRTDETYRGLTVYRRSGAYGGLGQNIHVETGETYTFSGWVKVDSSAYPAVRTIYVTVSGSSTNATVSVQQADFDVYNNWQRISLTFQVLNSGNIRPRIEAHSGDTSTTYICGLQLEAGNIATTHKEASAVGQKNGSNEIFNDYTNNAVSDGDYSHVEGYNNKIRWENETWCGDNSNHTGSHAEGRNNVASSLCAHVGGEGNVAHVHQTILGRYAGSGSSDWVGKESFGLYEGSLSSYTLFGIGSGTSGTARKNAFRVTGEGGVYGQTSYATGADYAEYFEWADGNPDGEDRRGLFVTLDGEKIRPATASDAYILGVVSALPGVMGDAYEDDWQGRYEKDVYGTILEETVVHPDRYEDDGRYLSGYVSKEWKVNSDYNPDEPYVPRSERSEWSPVGLLGKLTIRDDGSCVPGKFAKPNDNGVGTLSEDAGYYVMARIDDSHVRVLVK